MDFTLLKKATSINIGNLHKAITLQQTYTTSLCRHMNTIYSKLAQLEKQIQTHCLCPHSQSDVVQVNTPRFDPDIDGQLNIMSHADNTKEPALVTTNSDHDSTGF